jgi:protein gp37
MRNEEYGMNTTSIEWTRTYHPDGTYTAGYSSNPLKVRAIDPRTGRLKIYHHCVKQGPECTNCYAEALNLRWGTGRTYTAANDSQVEWLLDEREFVAWAKAPAGSKVFVGDMTDLFHKDVPDVYLDRIGAEIAYNSHLTIMCLTKRAQRGAAVVQRWVAKHGPLPHLWFGVSCGTQHATWRLRYLQQAPAGRLFISYEPALEAVDFRRWLVPSGRVYAPISPWGGGAVAERPAVDWIICGGESGPHHRPFNPDWARQVRDACRAYGVAFFFKQHGGRTPKAGGRLLDGVEWNQFPGQAVAA